MYETRMIVKNHLPPHLRPEIIQNGPPKPTGPPEWSGPLHALAAKNPGKFPVAGLSNAPDRGITTSPASGSRPPPPHRMVKKQDTEHSVEKAAAETKSNGLSDSSPSQSRLTDETPTTSPESSKVQVEARKSQSSQGQSIDTPSEPKAVTFQTSNPADRSKSRTLVNLESTKSCPDTADVGIITSVMEKSTGEDADSNGEDTAKPKESSLPKELSPPQESSPPEGSWMLGVGPPLEENPNKGRRNSKWAKVLSQRQYDNLYGPPPRREPTRAEKSDLAKQAWDAKGMSYTMKKWLQQLSPETLVNVQTNCEEFISFRNAEIAPRSWIPTSIDGHSPQEWWQLQKPGIPRLLNYPDPNYRPWWNRYNNRVTPFIYPLCHPLTTSFASDEHYHMIDDEVDREYKIQGPKGVFGIWKPERRSDIDITRRNASEQHTNLSAMQQKGLLTPHPAATPLQPEANFFIRIFTPESLVGVTEVLNWEILNGFSTDDRETRSQDSVRDWINDSLKAGLPCLVAVSRPSEYRKSQDMPGRYKVMGFAIAEEWGSRRGAFRFTAEVSVFVHGNNRNRGVGSALLDSMLHILDDGYPLKGGYAFPRYNQMVQLQRRPIKTIMVSLMYDPHDKALGHATRHWLVDKFGFLRTAHFDGIGVAQQRFVNMDMFSRSTDTKINPTMDR